MKKFASILALMVALCVCVGVMTACTGSDEETKAPSTTVGDKNDKDDATTGKDEGTTDSKPEADKGDDATGTTPEGGDSETGDNTTGDDTTVGGDNTTGDDTTTGGETGSTEGSTDNAG